MFQHLRDSRFQLSFEEIWQVDNVGSRKLLQLMLRTFLQLLGRVCCKRSLKKNWSIQSHYCISKLAARYLRECKNTFLRLALVGCCFAQCLYHKMHELIFWGMYMYLLRAKSQCHLGIQSRWQHFPSLCFLSSLLDSNSEMWNIVLVRFEKYTNYYGIENFDFWSNFTYSLLVNDMKPNILTTSQHIRVLCKMNKLICFCITQIQC